ncbi:alpha-actinin sarcomeric-like protein [Anaeramoeba flamelloides]|uniref:Alpha-actinin sarcomeric-like protein n=1 Tax=Anaeramoeba flamelloides TaxID=1746091 RepID=A0AAV7ZL27_9EUKA|nr:alpha-actinin sarcomeric-like protein [Anaeramoeba flamelloides]
MSIMDQSWVKVQQKAFTRWCNAHLGKRGIQIKDLRTGFKTGLNLIQLLEVIGDHTFGRYTKKPRMEIQMRENLKIAFKFLESKVKLVAIGSGDVYEGNLKLILGMIWTIILRFAIAEISVEELTAKEALLLWCQRKTADYDNVDVKEFTWSWQDGLGFCALIHKHRPDLIDYESLDPKNKEENLNLAFDIAEKELGLPKFLDAEDMVDVKPDERAVMTYLAEYFKYFSKGQKAENAGRRIGKIAQLEKEINEMKEAYEDKAGPLKTWIEKKIKEIPDYEFDNTLEGVEKLIDEFKDYEDNEKPPKLQEKNELETLLNNLKIKLSNNNRPPYDPPEGLSSNDINKLWDDLESKEKDRTEDMDEEYQRQKLIRKLEEEFYRRAKALESWAEKKEEYLNTKEEVDTLQKAKTKIRVFEAYNKEYELSRNRLNPCIDLGKQIIELKSKQSDKIQEKMDELNKRWDEHLPNQAEQKNEQLQEDLKRELKKEELRKEFAKQAREYNRWHKDQIEVAQDHIFGDDLESVTEFKTNLDETQEEITTQSKDKKEKLEDLDKQLTELGSTDNKYSPFTIEDIQTKHDQLMNLLKEREDAYNKELERQTIMENKRKEFAELANELADLLEKIRKDINKLEGEPEDMVSGCEDIYQEGTKIDELVEKLKKCDDEQKELGIRSNSHTKYTYPKLNDNAEELKEWAEETIEYWKDEKVKKEKRQAFAELANEYGPLLEKMRKEINKVKGEPEEALPKVEEIYGEGKEIDEKLEELQSADQECKEHSTGANPYTKYTFAQLEDEADELKEFGEETIENWKLEKVKKDKRKEFAELADSFGELLDKIRTDLNNLKGEPEDMITGIEEIYQEGKELDEKLEALKKVDDECKELQTGDNPYTKHTYPRLENLCKDLKKWAEKNLENWKEEKVKKDKRKEFAELADAYGELLDKIRTDINDVKGEPEEMISGIEEIYQEGKEIDEKLEELKKVDDEQKELGIRSNKYTKYTYPKLAKNEKDLKKWAEKLIENWKEEKVKKDKRKEFAEIADVYGELLDKIREDLNKLKGEPEDMITGIEEIYQEGKEIDEKLEELKKVDDEQKELKIRSNKYTKYTYRKLDRNAKELKKYAEKLIEDWKDEKVKKDKRKAFAELANVYGPFLEKIRKEINAVKGEPEEALPKVEEIYGEGKEIDEKLEELRSADQECHEHSTGANPYTKYTFPQLEDEADELKEFGEETIENWKDEQVKKDKRQAFAELANVYGPFLEKIRKEINAVKGEPEEALPKVEEIYGEGKEIDEKLEELQKADQECHENNTGANPYTKYTFSQLNDESFELKKWSEKTIENWKEEKVKKEKRLEFAPLADSFGELLDRIRTEINDVKGEPEDMVSGIEEIYQEGKEIDEKLEELKKVDHEQKELGIRSNKYTKYTYPKLAKSANDLQKWALKLIETWKVEKVKKDKRQVFAELADEYAEFLAEIREKLNSVKGEPEDALELVVKVYKEGKEIDEKLEELKKVDDEQKENKIRSNKYTKHTFGSLKLDAKELKEYAEKLIEDWKDEKVKKEKRQAFAKLANEYAPFLSKMRKEINAVKGEPEDALPKAEKAYGEGKEIDEKLEELRSADHECQEQNTGTNPYTKYSFPQLEDEASELKEFGEETIENWKQEIVKKTKRQEFAELANAYGDYLKKTRTDINKVKGEPEEMITGIEEIYQEGKEIDEKLEALRKVDDESKELQTGENPYTKYTFASLEDYAKNIKEWALKLIETWKQEKVKKDKRKEFAELADAYGDFLGKIRTDLKNLTGEPEEMITGIEEIYQEGKELDEKMEALKKVDEEQKELGIRSNKYTKYTYGYLDKGTQNLKKWAEKTLKHWNKEKVKKDKRKEFAELADAHFKFLEEKRESINNLKGEPEEMITGIEEIYQEGKELDEKLEELKKVDEEQKELGIRSNKYTKYTYGYLEKRTKELKKFAEKYLKEWKEEKVKKDKRKEYAELADEYAEYLDEITNKITSIEGEPEDRFEKLTEEYKEGKEINEKLEPVKQSDDQCRELQTGNNPYTKNPFGKIVKRNQRVHQICQNLNNSAKEDIDLKEKSIQQEKENKEAARIENLLVEYYDAAQKFKLWGNNFNDLLTAPIIAESPEEVKELIEQYNKFCQEKEETQTGKLEELRKISEELIDAGVEDFLGLPIEELNTAWELIESAVGNKKTELDEALALQEKNEELCQRFANQAEELQNHLKEQQEIANKEGSGSINEQIQTVKKQLAQVGEKKEVLEQLKELDKEIAERNVENKKTNITIPNLTILYETVLEALNKKINALEAEKLIKEGSKVSKEQLDEFKQMFELFDKKKKGGLFPYEFSAVLNSLGDDLSEEDLKKVFDKYDEDKSGTIEFNEFVEFMTSRVEDSDTLEQSLESWKIIAKDKDFVTEQDMQMAGMKKEEIEFLKEEMPEVEGGYDYKAWCPTVYGKN